MQEAHPVVAVELEQEHLGLREAVGILEAGGCEVAAVDAEGRGDGAELDEVLLEDRRRPDPDARRPPRARCSTSRQRPSVLMSPLRTLRSKRRTRRHRSQPRPVWHGHHGRPVGSSTASPCRIWTTSSLGLGILRILALRSIIINKEYKGFLQHRR